MEKLTVSDIPPMFERISWIMDGQQETLTRLDAEMGDGDLGLTMSKGFRLLSKELRLEEGEDIGALLIKAGRMLASGIPSTMGTLMASGLLEGGKLLRGTMEMGAEELVLFLKGFCSGLAKRGKCQPGDRTVLDAMDAAAREAAKACQEDGRHGLEEIANCAVKGAKDGVERTRTMQPKFGKAVVHIRKAMGTIDQGAFAGALFIEGIYDYIAHNSRCDG